MMFVLQSWPTSLCSERFASYTKQWLAGACRPWDIWWWEVTCKFYNVLWDICQALWPSSTQSCPSIHSIQAASACKTMQETLWFLIWANRVSRLKTPVYKLDLICFSNHLALWFGSDLQKSDFTCFFTVQTSWNQSEYNQDMPKIWFGLVVWTAPKTELMKITIHVDIVVVLWCSHSLQHIWQHQQAKKFLCPTPDLKIKHFALRSTQNKI